MSANFPNNPTDSSLPEIGMSDPNNSAITDSSAGGKTKIKPTSMDGMQSMSAVSGYGYMSPDLKNVGFAPSGENSSGIPAAQPITPMTFGDPNDTAVDFKDGTSINSVSLTGTDYVKYGFETPVN